MVQDHPARSLDQIRIKLLPTTEITNKFFSTSADPDSDQIHKCKVQGNFNLFQIFLNQTNRKTISESDPDLAWFSWTIWISWEYHRIFIAQHVQSDSLYRTGHRLQSIRNAIGLGKLALCYVVPFCEDWYKSTTNTTLGTSQTRWYFRILSRFMLFAIF